MSRWILEVTRFDPIPNGVAPMFKKYAYMLDIRKKTEKIYYQNGTIHRTTANAQFHKVASISGPTYDSGSWVLRKSEEIRIQTSEMKLLRYALQKESKESAL